MAAGYHWEEISNWARPGHECRHNGLYWDQGDYAGIGSAAHSHRDGERWWNVRTPDRYVEAMESGRSPEAGREVLTDDQRAFEALSISLRTPRGVPWDSLRDPADLAGPDPDARDVASGFDELVTRQGERAVLTVRGRLLANEVSTRIRSGILLR